MQVQKPTFAQSFAAVGLSSLIFLTGCGASAPTPAADASTSTSASAPATATASPSSEATTAPIELNPVVTAGMTPEQIEAYRKEVEAANKMTPEEAQAKYEAENGPFANRLVVDAQTVKAGSSLRVTGGTYAPGTSIQIYGAQQMAMPSYDAANDMYHQVGDEVKLTEVLTVVTDEKGQFDVQLPIPAGTAPQLLNILSIYPGGGDLVMTTVN